MKLRVDIDDSNLNSKFDGTDVSRLSVVLRQPKELLVATDEGCFINTHSNKLMFNMIARLLIMDPELLLAVKVYINHLDTCKGD